MYSHEVQRSPRQQARLVGLDALGERLLNVNGAADAVLGSAQRQLDLREGKQKSLETQKEAKNQAVPGKEQVGKAMQQRQKIRWQAWISHCSEHWPGCDAR